MPPINRPRGYGALSVYRQEQVVDMIKAGATIRIVAENFSVTKNTVAGIWSRHGEPGTRRVPTTLYARLDALHAKLDRVLDETRGVGRIPESERVPRR